VKIALVTLFPEMFKAVTDYGVTGRAFTQGLAEIAYFNPRDCATDNRKTVDDRPFGGGPGMVMMIEPLRKAISQARSWVGGRPRVIYLSPQGKLLDHRAVVDFSKQEEGLVLVAGRYEGIDERLLLLEVDEEWSIGDYVLSGGELPAMVLIDAVLRQIPGVLGHKSSAEQDSFTQGLLDCDQYTRPEIYEDLRVPEVLLSGNHEKIRRWRLKKSLERTHARRPDLLSELELTKEQSVLLAEVLAEKEKG